MRRCLILANDHSALSAGTGSGSVRKDDQVTQVGLILPKEGSRRVIDVNQWALKQSGAIDCAPVFYGDTYSVETGVSAAAAATATARVGMPAGVYNLDFRKYIDPATNPWGPVAGLNMIGKQPGDVKLAMTIGTYSSGDDVHMLWDELLPCNRGR